MRNFQRLHRFVTFGSAALILSAVGACSGARQGTRSTTPAGSTGDQTSRFTQLEVSAEELDSTTVSELPEVADEDRYFVVDAVIETPSFDPDRGGLVLLPPQEWTIGVTADQQDVRLELLEPEGGAMVVEAEGELEGVTEASVTWLVRYSRRNILLTEAGRAVAVHVVPVAARFEVAGEEPSFWISSEAPTP